MFTRTLPFFLLAAMALPGQNGPQYTADGQLKYPENYREWVFLTSGVGMTYGPAATFQGPPMFDNVFVSPPAYHSFKETGHWPDKTMFILEIRASETNGSINKGGHFQTDVMAIEVAVKDESRKPGPWSYYDFPVAGGKRASTAKVIPTTASCYQCHGKNTAVENTFVQFYPTLYEIAERKGTFNASFQKLVVTPGKLFDLVVAGGWAKAEPALNDAASRTPSANVLHESSLNNLGGRLLREKRPAEAVKIFEWAVNRYPRSSNLYDSMADAYLAAGEKDAARKASEKALALLPNDSSVPEARKEMVKKAAEDRLKQLR